MKFTVKAHQNESKETDCFHKNTEEESVRKWGVGVEPI